MRDDKQTPRNVAQSGSMLLALFGAVAMLGVVGAGLNTVMRGPVSTMADVTKKTVAENNMMTASKLAVVMAPTTQTNSGDCDADGFTEPYPFRDAGTSPKPAGGGYIPNGIGAALYDPWNTQYGYCAWDHGPKTTTDNVAGCGGSSARRLKGVNNGTQSAIAIISAGKDKIFQTSCNAYADVNSDGNPDTALVLKPATSDDMVSAYTYAEANNVGGGGNLWAIKAGTTDTAAIAKDLEVSGDASFGGVLRLTGGLVLPGDPGNDSITGGCNAANDQQLRRNTSQNPPTLEICDFAGGFTSWTGILRVATSAMPAPGAACSVLGEYRAGKPAALPSGYILTCDGSAYQTLFTYDILTGALSRPGTPTLTTQIVNKQYVDNQISVFFNLPSCTTNEALVSTGSGYSCFCDDPSVVWTQRTSSGSRNWEGVASSSDGLKIIAGEYGGYIYRSTNAGSTWTALTSAGIRYWNTLASSSDGVKLAAMVRGGGNIYTSADSGTTWTARTGAGSRNWGSLASSADGTKIVAGVENGYIYTSADSGATWTQRTSAGSRAWVSIEISDDGQKIVAPNYNGYIYTSVDGGVNWVERTTSGVRSWYNVAASSDGSKIVAPDYNGYIYTSADGGATWTQRTSAGARSWNSASMSDDGLTIAAGATTGNVYLSKDGGVSWAAQTSSGSKNWQSLGMSSDGSRIVAGTLNSLISTAAPLCKVKACTLDGVKVDSGASVTAYQLPTPYGTACATQSRSCFYGNLSGSFSGVSCKSGFNKISTGRFGTCGITTTGAVWCWGAGSISSFGSGFIGNGSNANQSIPTAVTGAHVFTQLESGYYLSCALKSNGSAWCWGFNSSGQLGDGTSVDKNVPTAVSGGHVFQSITAGGYHACGLKADGSAWCWGRNDLSQLGDGTTANKSVPTAVSGGHVFQSIDAGANHTCGLKADGTAWCWGRNNSGQVGDNTLLNKLVPTAVTGGNIFKSISLGDQTCGLKSDGSLFCWGRNDFGQLGDGTTVNKSVPTAVSGGHSFTEVDADLSHTCALKNNGAAWCWGNNAGGQLGDGTTTNKVSPTAVTGDHIFKSVTTGQISTCGVKTNGEVLCWGYNIEGQIGDNTLVNKSVPTPIYQP